MTTRKDNVCCPHCGHVFSSVGKQCVSNNYQDHWKELVDRWNTFAKSRCLARVNLSNGPVKNAFVRSFSSYPDKDQWWKDVTNACRVLAASPFHMGDNPRRWTVTLGYLLRPGKIEELSAEYTAAKEREKAHAPAAQHAPAPTPGGGPAGDPGESDFQFASGASRIGGSGRRNRQDPG